MLPKIPNTIVRKKVDRSYFEYPNNCTLLLVFLHYLNLSTNLSTHSLTPFGGFLLFRIFFNGCSHAYFENMSITASRYFTPLFSLAWPLKSTRSAAHILSTPGEYTCLLGNLRLMGLWSSSASSSVHTGFFFTAPPVNCLFLHPQLTQSPHSLIYRSPISGFRRCAYRF